MGNKQKNQQPRHDQPTHEGQRLGGNNQGGKAPEHLGALDQGGEGGDKRTNPKTDDGDHSER